VTIIEKYDRYFIYAGVLFNLIIAYRFYALWASPGVDQANQITNMAVLIAFEFIMVHSGLFMAVFPKRISLLIFFPFYGVFALSFAAIIDDWHIILVTYLFVVFNRMRFAFADVPKVIKSRNIIISVLAVLIYFIGMFIVAFGAEYLPELGLTQKYLETSGYLSSLDTSGLFFDVPQTAMALGLFYYVALAIVEFLFVWFRKRFHKAVTAELAHWKRPMRKNKKENNPL
jgi:hypothetical protein